MLAVSTLLVATLVSDRSTAALNTGDEATTAAFSTGTIELTDDDDGHSLFDLQNLVPGAETVECIAVTYTGSILPVELSLTSRSVGSLSPYLNVVIDQGTGGGYGDCVGFSSEQQIFDGTLATLTDTGTLPVGVILSIDEPMTFRFSYDVADVRDALGKVATADFIWEAVPS